MSTQIVSSFQRLVISEKELLSGTILSSMQLAVIQNMRVDIAEQKLALKFTPNDIHSYTQQEAFLTGQLEILQHIIDSSDAASKQAVQQAAIQSQSQSKIQPQE